MSFNPEDFLPDIEEYLENVNNSKAVSSKGLEEVALRVRARTGLDIRICRTIIGSLFGEIRNAMLRGDIVKIRGLGKFFMSSPLYSSNKERVFPKFKPYKKLIKRMNDK